MQIFPLYYVMICVFCLFLPHFWMLSDKVSIYLWMLVTHVRKQHLSVLFRGRRHRKNMFLYLLPVGLKGGSEEFNCPENLFLYLKYFFG